MLFRSNEAARQYVGHPHKEIPARVTLVRMILTFVEDFDKNIDKVIAERINKPCSRRQDPFVFLISVLCIDIAESFGHTMKITDTMALCVKVLANRCHSIVDVIMAEEDAAESAHIGVFSPPLVDLILVELSGITPLNDLIAVIPHYLLSFLY